MDLLKHKSKRIFTHPETISRHLLCCICQDVFEDPVRVMCGHTFCYVCIEHWALIKSTCPMCKQPFGARKIEKDLIAAGIVGDLEVKCFHEGCDWTGIESLRKKHQRCCYFKPRNQMVGYASQQFVEINDISEPEDVDELEILSSPIKY